MPVMRKALLLLLAALLITSCASKAPKKVDNPGNLYVEGVELAKKKKYGDAAERFIQIRENYPFDPFAIVAAVKLGDAYFDNKEYVLAAGVYDDFFNAHPEDENVPYVLKRLGECYEKLSESIDRDQANTLKAIERFTYLKNRYPQNQYAKDADEHIKILTAKLAAREVYVGEFYYRTGKYNAATLRLEYFLNKYPNARDRDKALFYVSDCYRYLKEPEKSQLFADRLLSEFPKSTYARAIQRERKSLQVKKTEARVPATAQPAAAAAKPEPASPAEKLSYASVERKKKEIELVPPAVTAPPASMAPAPRGGSRIAVQAAGAAEPKPAKPVTSPVDETKNEAGATAVVPVVVPKEETATNSPRAIEAAAPPQQLAGQSATGGKETEKSGLQQKGDARAEGRGSQEAKGEGQKQGPVGFFSKKEPVDVVADSMEGLENGKIIVFKGNVVAKQVDLSIFCETLTAYLNEDSSEIERAHATGNVKIVKQDRIATAKDAFFDNTKGEITLKGDVVAYVGADKVTGETVVYYINEDRLQVLGEKDKRARAILSPKKDSSKK